REPRRGRPKVSRVSSQLCRSGRDGQLSREDGRTKGRGTPMRIAVADDDAEARAYFARALARLGHDAVAVSTGRKLVGLCTATAPDLVIADVFMPDETGIEAACELNKHRELPVILVTGRDPGELLAQDVTDHVMAFLLKPVGEEQLRAAIPLALRRFEQYKAL